MTSIIITLLIVFYRVPLINILGDKGMGYYSIALTLYLLFMTFISYGIPKALTTIITEQSSKGQFALAYKTITSSLLFSVITGGIAALFLFFGADMIAQHLMYAAQGSMSIQGIAPCLLFISVLGVLHGVYMGTRVPAVSRMIQRIEELFVAILSILCAFIARNNAAIIDEPIYSSLGASIGYTGGIFISFLLSMIIYINHGKKLKHKAKKNSAIVKETRTELILLLVKTTLPVILTMLIFHFSCIIDYAVFNRIMSVQGHKESSYIILLGMLNGKYEFFVSIPFLFVNWYAASKIPALTKIAQEENIRKIHNKISQSLRYTMLYIIPLTVIYILFAKPLMNLFFTGINDTPALLLRTGAVSIIFYSLAAISNAALNALDEWAKVAKNAFISLVVQGICLLIMMIIFQWTIIAVVVSRIIFSATLYILNEHVLRERTGYIQEQKRTFQLPAIAAIIMGIVSFIVFFIFNLFIQDKTAVILALIIAVPTYIFALIFLGGITQREMYRLPGGNLLAPLCKKLHLIK